jgi:hypothetical protein
MADDTAAAAADKSKAQAEVKGGCQLPGLTPLRAGGSVLRGTRETPPPQGSELLSREHKSATGKETS